MTTVVEINVEPLSPAAFAPFGEVVGPSATEAVFLGPDFQLWRTSFGVEGDIELMFARYHHKPMRFHRMERHLQVTQSFLPLGGGRSVMVVAAPTGAKDPENVPRPEDVHAFHLDGTQGVLLWKGTWHALDRFPVSPPHTDFALITGLDTQRELEKQALDGTPPRLTQVDDFLARRGLIFEVVDPHGLVSRG